MITRIDADRYGCLRRVGQPVNPFNILVGPNGSGKSTLMDVIRFLSDLTLTDVAKAIDKRTSNYFDLPWKQRNAKSDSDEFALFFKIAAEIPESLRLEQEHRLFGPNLPRKSLNYSITIGCRSGNLTIDHELLSMRNDSVPGDYFTILQKNGSGTEKFFPEIETNQVYDRKFSTLTTALSNLPADKDQFPFASWFKNLMTDGIRSYELDNKLMREPSPPRKSRGFQSDGSNLPHEVEELRCDHPSNFARWIAHLRTAIPDFAGIRTIELEHNKHRHLMLRFEGGVEVPSWMASEGTLRLMALTLPAYLPDNSGIYLIEEPENGIHPKAIETAIQSLSNMQPAQVFIATHSPIVLGLVEPKDILCFGKNAEGATEIVNGADHPLLSEWKGIPGLGALFAGGVLG